jgi:hypothetical protein
MKKFSGSATAWLFAYEKGNFFFILRLEKPPLSFYLGPYSHVVKMKRKYALLSIQ